MNKPILALALSASLLAGCAMIPHYERPASPVADAWPVETADTATSSAAGEVQVAGIAWQEFFRSPELRSVIATALEHNRDLRIAALNVEAARAQYRIQRSELVPTVNAEVSGSKQRMAQNLPIPGAGGGFINEFYTAQVNFSYELDFFGRIQSLSRSAQQQFLATREAQQAVQVALIAQTANAWLQLQADRAILQLTEDTLAAQERSYNLISERFEHGISSRLELAQAQIPLETARANHALYTRLVQQDKNALSLLMGVPADDALLAAQPLNEGDVLLSLPVGLPSEVLLHRPDIREAEHRLLSANANIGAARAAFFPSISLTAGFGEASNELDNLFTSASGSIWSFMPRISLPIFHGGRNFANLGMSKANRDIAVAQYEKSIQTAFREVADELAARATLTEQLQAQTQLVEASQSAYDVSQARHDQGVDSFLAVLDAQRSLYTAEQGKIEIEKQRLANLVNLYRALGGGQVTAEVAAYTPQTQDIPAPITEPEEEAIAPDTAPLSDDIHTTAAL